ncbi:hypothetical protein AYI68_g1562 [Smittium mucronatum]|uniref:Uncharacterized protein n=1 Tax=Smittium mucronatum TaxID=133383 RepID=A0A1R0H5B8_9FUNG|nr:hypothetical protein AYI68_g1562 [Smittium mucronatum]
MTEIPEEDHLETGETDRLAQLRHSLVHNSSVRQSDGSQRLTAICRNAMLINPTFGYTDGGPKEELIVYSFYEVILQ